MLLDSPQWPVLLQQLDRPEVGVISGRRKDNPRVAQLLRLKGNSEQVAHQQEMGSLGMPKSPIFSR